MSARTSKKGNKGKSASTGKKQPIKLSEAAAKALANEIDQKAEHLRKLKTDKAPPATIYRAICDLLETKFKHPDHLHWCYAKDAPKPLPPKVMKLRWRVPIKKNDEEAIRLQVTLKDRTSLSGREVSDLIAAHTAKKFPELGGFLRIEHKVGSWGMPGDTAIHSVAIEVEGEDAAPAAAAAVARKAKATSKKGKKKKKGKKGGGEEGAAEKAPEGGKDGKGAADTKSTAPEAGPSSPAAAKPVYRALCNSDVYRLPLVTPGPRLADVAVLEFRVTFPAFESHRTTPVAYSGLRQLPRLMDVGVNLFDKAFAKDTPTVVQRAYGAGVETMVLISTTLEDARTNLDLCARHRGSLFTTVGLHPLQAATVDISAFDKLREMVVEARRQAEAAEVPCPVVAVGECGLDYKDGDGATADVRARQREWFEAQLKLAAELSLPVLVHERLAFDDTVKVLENFRSTIPNVLINCFTGTLKQLEAYEALDAYVGVSGVIADAKKGPHLPEVFAALKADRMVIGTDAPYMLPFNMPRPFPKRNEPAFLPHVLVALSEARDTTDLCMLANTLWENSCRLFPGVAAAPAPFDGTLVDAAASVARAQTTGGDGGRAVDDVGEAVAATSLTPLQDLSEAEQAERLNVTLDGQRLFVHVATGGTATAYLASEKEHAILTKQAAALGATSPAFASLLEDFGLQRLN